MKQLALVFVLACGGDDPAPTGSGVDETLAIGTLTPGEIDDVCGYGVALSREVVCNGNPTQSVAVLDSCVDLLEMLADGCVATVDDMEACFEALAEETDAQVCALENPAACEFLGDPSCFNI